MKILQMLMDIIAPPDRFELQAREDQRSAAYPGCRKGLMLCTDLLCPCDERRPSRAFVRARAARLRRDAGEEITR